MIVGDQIDHYHIDQVVARSGMASIFRATDLQTGKTVAIKVPHEEMECDPVLFERFKREEEIGTKLRHPGVMQVFDGEERCQVYMVMEWIEGQLLRQILQTERKLPAERAVKLTLEICDALDYIHSQGVVHRDLKPENIMVNDQDGIKLIDFGIAAKNNARRITFAKFSQTLGTPDYISPEQVKGQSGDGRSDIYALGVMLYEMLTGQVPFRGANPLLIMNDRLMNNPIPPRAIDPDISPELQEVIYRALERDPGRRYRRASEFAWDLQHLNQVKVVDRSELVDWKTRREPWARNILFYVAMALIPVIVFALLYLVARHT